MGLNVRNEIIVIAYNLNMYHNIIYIYIAKLSRASHGLATSYYYFGNINCLSKIFSKIDFKFYSNITTHNKTYRYI